MNGTNEQKLVDTDNSMVVTRGKWGGVWRGEVKKGKGNQLHGDGRRFDFGW